MDPNATLVRIITEETAGGTADAAYDLQRWLENGGFQPERSKLTAAQWTAMVRMFVALAREVY